MNADLNRKLGVGISMPEERRVKSAEMFPLVQEIFDNGGSARIIVTGMSMYPFLSENRDSVELIKSNFSDIKRGDIVLALRDSGQYFLHRIWRKKTDSFYLVGDAQTWIDGPYRPDQLIAFVRKVWRKERVIDCSSLWWRITGTAWLLLRPFRGYILRIFSGLRKIVKILRKDL